jgi:hypothetical protein
VGKGLHGEVHAAAGDFVDPDLCEPKVSGKVISRAEAHGAGKKP